MLALLSIVLYLETEYIGWVTDLTHYTGTPLLITVLLLRFKNVMDIRDNRA